MKKIYGLSLAIPKEIDSDLCIKSPNSDIKVSAWSLDSKNISEVVTWYHHWQMPDGHIWLSSGKNKNGLYVLHFVDENIDFAFSFDGKEIYYQCLEKFNAEDVRHILLTQVLPLVLNLRGTEALHASSVLSLHGAVVFIGKSGAGKSTISTGLLKRGFSIISDNVVPVFERSNKIWTSSGPPDLGVWPWV